MENKVTKKETGITLYTDVSIGTEQMGQEDINTPNLKIIQPNTQGIDNKREGTFYRSDTREQLEEVDAHLVYVTTAEVENYNKTGLEKVKIYYGYYWGTNEPFKMYVRGWGLASHREFQTEVVAMKNKYKVPMLALTIQLTTEKQSGTIAQTGKPYSVYKPVFNIVKDEKGNPLIEQDPERIQFLVKSAHRFADLSLAATSNDNTQNEVNLDDLPEYLQ